MLCNDAKTYKKNAVPEGEMNLTMSRCASKISFVWLSSIWHYLQQFPTTTRYISIESPFQVLCNDAKTYKKNPLPEGEMNFTLSRCASKISFVWLSGIWCKVEQFPTTIRYKSIQSPFQLVCNDAKRYKKNPLPEGEMNLTMNRCASNISFVWLSRIWC